MTERFTETLKQASEPNWAKTVEHRFVAEWLYLAWASRAPKPLPENFIHAEWITPHDNPGFRDFVAFLRLELDRGRAGEPK